MLVPGLAALVPLGWLWTRRGLVEPTASSAAPAFVSSPGLSHWRITALIILPFFLTYAGNEGFFTNFSLYLHVVHTPASWVGWSASISTVIGYALSGFFGRSADRLGGRRLFQTILLAYVLMYALMLAVPRPIVDVAVFSLPMYPVLSMSVVRASAERVKAGQLSSVMGVINGTTGLATSLGSTAMGVVAARLSPRAMPWLADALAILAWAMVLAIRERQPAWKEEAS
jgi:predicted MFS family arabinose efflux permease